MDKSQDDRRRGKTGAERKQRDGIVAYNPISCEDKGKSFMGGDQRLMKVSVSKA